MKKRDFVFSIIILLGIILFPKNVFAKELNITSINSGNVGGESTLLESNGKYLLMDTCDASSNPAVINYLKGKTIDIYISHYHQDHFGELLTIVRESLNTANNYTIKNIYLPEDYLTYILGKINDIPATTADQNTNKLNAMTTINNLIDAKDQVINYIETITTASKKPTIKYLNASSSAISIGDASLSIIGPVKNQDQLATEIINTFTSDPYGALNTVFINNKSLVAMVKVDNTKFLTAGDIEYYEEQALISSGKDLKADVMKLSHHALGKNFASNRLSNNTSFMAKVNPKYAFFSRPEEYLGEETNIANILADSKSENRNIINLYSAKYNGTTTINIKDNIITVNPTSNYKTIKVEYRDKDTNKEIATARYYNFSYNTSTDSNSIKLPFKLYEYKKSITGYTFDSATDANGDEIVTSANEITSGNVYTLKYTKNTTPSEVEADDKTNNKTDDKSNNSSSNNNSNKGKTIEVPNTSMTTSVLFTIVGLIIMISGVYVIYRGKKQNKLN